jgi:hypothetical protein
MAAEEDEVEVSYDELKQQTRDGFKGFKATQLVHQMALLQELKDTAEENIKRVNAQLDVVRLELIPAAMEDEGIASPFNVTGVGRVTLTPDMYVSLDKSKKQEFYGWLEAHNLQSLIVPTVNSSTLKAFTKERMKKGLEIPDAIKTQAFTRASITRS